MLGLHIFWVVCRLRTWTTLTYLLTGLLTRSIILSHAFSRSPTTTLNSLKVLTGVGCSLMHMGGNLWVWCFFIFIHLWSFLLVIMLFLDIIYLHSLLVPNDQPLPYPGAHDWLHSTPPSKPKEEAMGPPPLPMPEEEEETVQPSLKDWLDCPGTSNHRLVDTPTVAIEVILSKPSHNFHTCCTMCIHML